MKAMDLFLERSSYDNDIRDHMPTLFHAARGTVLELGVGEGRSTSAFLAGLEARGEGRLISVDSRQLDVMPAHPRHRFICADSLDGESIRGGCAGWVSPGFARSPPLAFLDVLFIDTDHTYERTSRELHYWGPTVRTGGVILLHDTRSSPEVMKAMIDFCRDRPWLPFREQSHNNGLGHIFIPGHP